MPIESLHAELQRETTTTRRFLQRVPPEQWAWRPHVRSFTVGGLAGHLVDCLRWVEPIVALDKLDVDPTTYRPCRADSLEALLVAYDEVVATGTSVLARHDATAMAASWRLKLGGRVRFERPRTDVLRDLTLSHLIHHRGQLSVYLRYSA